MIVGGQTEARAQLSSTIIDYHEPFDQGLTRQENKRMITNAKVNHTSESVTFSWEFVIHKSINVFEVRVTRVGSVIN